MFLPTNPAKHCCLHGIFRIGGQRSFTFALGKVDIFLVCDRFWKEGTLFAPLSEKGANITEIFTILNSNDFLERVQNKYLNIELRQRKDNMDPKVVGLLHLPLHQFFIAYRDASLMNRLHDGQFPVISVDKWTPILNPITGDKVGEIECLLAMGTEKQIENIKNSKPWNTMKIPSPMTSISISSVDSTTLHCLNKDSKYSVEDAPSLPPNSKTGITSNLLNVFQKSLATNLTAISHKESEINSFRLFLEIKSARNLPLNQSIKMKKRPNRSVGVKGRHIRTPPGEEPSTYVTFQANEGDALMVKSHEGMVYSTAVVEKNANPIWNVPLCISVSVNYLLNKNNRFILKVWKKVCKSNNGRTIPCPTEDAIIGLAHIELTDLLAVPLISGWFDIIDFNGHINGQINIIAKPFEDIKKLNELILNRKDNQVENLLDTFESSLEINNMNLSRAIKRKFTELEEISERLRARLLDVTGSTDVCTDPRELSDEQLEEFEHDLNTTACEDEIESFSSQTNYLKASQHPPRTQ